jgi:hypothetical protein
MYSVWGGGVGGAKGYRECDGPDWFNSFSVEAIEGL